MVILYLPTHRHIQLRVWNHWHETNSCLKRRSAAMSSAFFSMPLGQSLFRPTPDYPSPKRMESNSIPRKMSLTSENLVGIKDGCTLIVVFFFDQVKVSESDEVIGGCWIYCSTCIFMMNQQSTHLRFESIYRNHWKILYELDKYGEMLRIFTADDARILCLYSERHYKVGQRIHHDSLNSFKNVSWEEAWEWLDHWSFSFHSFFISKKHHTVDGSELRYTHQLSLVVYPIIHMYLQGFYTSQTVVKKIAGFRLPFSRGVQRCHVLPRSWGRSPVWVFLKKQRAELSAFLGAWQNLLVFS